MAAGDDEIQLADIDTTVPAQATQQKSILDNYQRGIRRASVASFGREHHLTGEHKFGHGTAAERDAANLLAGPVTGQLWIRTDTNSLERYDGTKWVRMHVYEPQSISLLNATGETGNQTRDLAWALVGRLVYWAGYPFVTKYNTSRSSYQTLARTPIWLNAGIYDFHTAIYVVKNSYTTSATVNAQVVIATSGGTTVSTIQAITSKLVSADTWTDNVTDGSASTTQTVSTTGWHTATLKMSAPDPFTVDASATVVGGVPGAQGILSSIGITAASLYWEPSTNG